MLDKIILAFGIAAAMASAALPAAAQLDSVRLVDPETAAPVGVVPLDAWFPRSIESRLPPFFEGGAYTRSGYIPLDRAEDLWDICASVPPTSFDYFDLIARGLKAEARRQGVLLRLKEIEDFDVNAQIADIEECLEDQADALIVVALEPGVFDTVFLRARERGVPVIDLTTGSDSRHVTARIVTDRVAVGRAAGQFLADRHPHGGDVANVVWLPSPAGSRIAQEEDLGFRRGIENGAVEIVHAEEVGLDEAAVRGTIRDLVESNLTFDAVVGGSLTTQIAAEELVGRFPPGAIELVSVSMIPSTVSGIVADQIFAGVNDQPVVQARIAVDLAVRAIEDRPLLADLRPALEIIDRSNVDLFDRATVLLP
jgi:protein TorT